MRHVRPKFGSNTPRTLTLPFTTQQAPMKLKLSFNQSFPNQSCFEFTSAEASGNLGFPRGINVYLNARYCLHVIDQLYRNNSLWSPLNVYLFVGGGGIISLDILLHIVYKCLFKCPLLSTCYRPTLS